ncbi:MAG: hypothetical protein JWL77_4563 [Chthonomonadaceae bacterium]|nr:hypothetical protein [Chthonomonadaceae bacterium]
MSLNLISQGFWLPKAGSSEEDYEDAIAIGPNAVAIADGATESSFARAWARALTEGFACEPLSAQPDLTELMDRVGPLQQQWHAGVAWDRLPWYAEDKARNGAFAALLTLRFEEPLTATETDEPSAERLWHALAIGDTCLFQIRDDALHLAFPLAESAAFDSTPLLLSSNPARNLQVWDQAQVLNGVFKPGDILLLMTDALAKWFLSEIESGAKPWQTLCTFTDQSELAALTVMLRAEHRLKNDDTSLICIQETSVVSQRKMRLASAPDPGFDAEEETRHPADDSEPSRSQDAPDTSPEFSREAWEEMASPEIAHEAMPLPDEHPRAQEAEAV